MARRTNGGAKRTPTKTTTKVATQKKETKVVQKQEPESNEFMVTVSRLGLKNAVDLVSAALPGKEFNDAKSGIFLESKYEGDNPMLYLTANSMNVFITHGFALQDDIGEGFVVPNGNTFKKVVSGLQSMSEPIEMSYDEEENTFALSCGEAYDSVMQHYDPVGFILPPSVEEIKANEEVSLPVKYIAEALDKVAFSCSNDMAVPELTGILIEQSKDGINFVGGDGNRLSYLSVRTKVKNPKQVIISVKYLRILNNILKTLEVKSSEVLTLYLSDDKVYFIHGNTIVGIQILAGKYPIDGGYEQFFFNEDGNVIDADDCDVSMVVDVDKFLDQLDLATMHNSSMLEPIMLTVSSKGKGKKDVFKFESTELSNNKFDISFDVVKSATSGDMQISFTPSYLYDAVRCLNVKQVMLGFQTDMSRAIVKPHGETEGNKVYRHIFSLN